MTRMKESGIDWIGQIPEEWEVKDIKHIFEEIGSGSTPKSDNEIFYDGDINWIQSGDLYQTDTVTSVSKTISYQGFKSTSALKIYKHPFIALAMYGASVGNVAISCIDACVNQAVVVMLGSSEKVGFGKYAIEASKSNLIFSAQGGTQPNISQNLIKNWSIPQPDSSEQTKIADFLDKKTAQLDKAKALLEEQIQKLKDYRASLIYETVTNGLDKTSPMKDSGIDWIGQVPGGWGVKPIKHVVATPVTDGPHETPLLCETGIPFLSAEAVKNGVLDFNYKRGYISLQDHERFKKKISPKKDDIFIVKSGATTGNVGIVNTDEIFDIWSPLALIRCKKSLAVQKYIYYYLISNIFKAQVEFNWSFGTQQNIGMGIIENIKLILPPLSEQTKISDFLDKKTVQIDQLIQIKNKQIKNINKQRQTLIYDYVTGKRRV